MIKRYRIANKYFFVFLIVAAFFLGSAESTLADIAEGFLVSDSGYPDNYFKGELKYAGIVPLVDMENMTTSFPARCTTTQCWSSLYTASGDLKIPQDGNYAIAVQGTVPAQFRSLRIKRENGSIVCNVGGTIDNYLVCPIREYKAGVYGIETKYAPSKSILQPSFSLKWQNLGAGTMLLEHWDNIPAQYLNVRMPDATEISIPNSGEARMSYAVSGVGTKQSGELSMQLPANIAAKPELIMENDVWVFWDYKMDGGVPDSVQLSVRNHLGVTRDLNGEWFRSSNNNMRLGWLMAKLNSDLITLDASGRLRLSFPSLGGRNEDGIAVVVPYEDPDKPLGKLRIKTLGSSVYGMASLPFTFDGLADTRIDHIYPFFVLPDGSGLTGTSTVYRANLVTYKTGSGGVPGSGSFFGTYNNMLLPENPRALNSSSTSREWYPAYGRDGAMLDVLARSENYAPNLATGTGFGGVMDFFPTKLVADTGGNPIDWISFQYASSNFPQNKGTSPQGSVESGGVMIAGLMTYSDNPGPRLKVCPSVPGLQSVAVGGMINFEAYYWSDRFFGPTCSEEDKASADSVVTLSAVWFPAPGSSAILSSLQGAVTGLSAGTEIIGATYLGLSDSLGVTVTDSGAPPPPPPPPPCTYTVCSPATGYNCQEKTEAIFPCPGETCAIGETCHNREPWKEVAP